MVDERTQGGLSGKRLLLVEDEYAIAADLTYAFENAGAEVIGPAGWVDEALALVAEAADRIDGALLDINLGNERVYPVADALLRKGIPFMFATGYDASAIPDGYRDVPRHEKPVDRARLLRQLAALVAD